MQLKVSFSFTITITIPQPPQLTVDTSGVPTSGVVGQAFSGDIKVSGGTPPYTFALDTPLPDGLTLNPDGTITGTPTKDGTFDVSGSVADSSS